MFQEIQLTNFKSFAGSADPIPLAPVTILVGANASGKSNLFDAFRFLQGIGMELSAAEILTGKRAGGHVIHPGLRGGTAEVCWGDEDAFGLRVAVSCKRDTVVWHAMGCQVSPAVGIASESTYVCEAADQHFPPKSPKQKEHSEGSESHSFLEAEDSEGEVFPDAHLLGLYQAIRFLNLRPAEMKQYVQRTAPELGEHGENLSAVVYRICQNADRKEQYLDWVSGLSAPPLLDIICNPTDTDDVLVQVVEGDGQGRRLSARSISDGTLRFMGVLAAMFTAPEGSVFFLEEIENGLHPTRIHLLVELFEQFAESRNLQIIATTHSSQVLLSLSEPALRSAILFARTEDTPGTITHRLGDLPHFEEVTQTTQIDKLFTTGWLEFAV